jgi:hypothetical protein
MRCAILPRYDGGMTRLLTLAFALFVSAAAADPVFPRGSRIGLVPPPGMTASTSFQGFEDRANRVVLLVSEVSAQTYHKVAQDFTPEAIRESGMEEISRETVRLASGEGLLVGTRQGENGTAVRKWALLTRTEDLTAIIIGIVPELAHGAYPDAAMRAAFASIMIRAKLTPDDMLAILPYRLGDLAGFRLLRTSPDGTAVMTLGPNDTTLPAEQPYFMIAPRAVEPPPAAERESFAQRMIAGFLSRPHLRIVNSEPLRIGGAPGYQIVAIGKDEQTGDQLAMVQWLRFSPGVVQMFGMARLDQWENVLPRMRAVRDGFGTR